MAPSLRERDTEEVNSQSSGSLGAEMSWQKRKRVQKNKEKWARVLKGQESDNTLPTTSSSSSELDDSDDSQGKDESDVGTRLRKHFLEARKNEGVQAKGNLSKREVRRVVRELKKSTKLSTKPKSEVVLPLSKIRLNADDDSDSGTDQKTIRRPYQSESIPTVPLDNRSACSRPDDECDDDGDNDPMESLRVKRLSNVRQEEEEKMREMLMESTKEQQRQKEKREQAKRKNLELEMSAPVVTAPVTATENHKSESEPMSNPEANMNLSTKPVHVSEIPPAAFPPSKPSQKRPNSTVESSMAPKEDTATEKLEKENRKQKVLEQMFKDGMNRTTPPKPSKLDIDIWSEISSQLDDAVSKASEKKKQNKQTLKKLTKNKSKKNDISTPEEEFRRALGIKGKKSSQHTLPQTPPLTPLTPQPIKLFQEESRNVESNWLDDLFSNVTTCCGPTGCGPAKLHSRLAEF
mmetsp:Transcript_6072/g.9307  ORF Transcript_6072/g.9307 Transcript_6072/m.9307 type:complete len:463 (+) Transcript_6072:120-1508(+)